MAHQLQNTDNINIFETIHVSTLSNCMHEYMSEHFQDCAGKKKIEWIVLATDLLINVLAKSGNKINSKYVHEVVKSTLEEFNEFAIFCSEVSVVDSTKHV